MRGKEQGVVWYTIYRGITPAYAGKRHISIKWGIDIRDHPCVCGEKFRRSCYFTVSEGSPLRMRGKVSLFSMSTFTHRITPAYAGKSLGLFNLSLRS